MIRASFAALLSATVLATPAFGQVHEALADNVLAQPGGPEALTARCEGYLDAFNADLAALEGAEDEPAVETTLARLDGMKELLLGGSAEFALYREVMDTAAEREAASDCEVRIEEAGNRLALSRPAYDRISAIDASGEDPETRFVLERALRDYRLSGVAFDAERRAKIKALKDEISEIGATFDRNIAESGDAIKALPEELTGLPADFIAAHAPGPDGLVTITTDYPDYGPVMSFADNDMLRERLGRVYMARAYPENMEVLKSLFAKRQELAELMEYPDYASLMLKSRMLDTPERVKQLLDEMAEAAMPASKSDFARKQSLLDELRPGQDLKRSFYSSWLSERIKERDYDLDTQEVRSYFTYDNVRDGVFALTERLFGMQIRPWDTPLWHEDAEAYEVVENGVVTGRFYLDSHPRPGKYKHGNAIPLRSGVRGKQVPMAALVMNLPKGGYETGLMTHSAITTFFHEFGHLVHMLSQDTRWASSNPMYIEWDFVEAPSQMLENWMYDYETLASFGRNEAGETIPRELVEKLQKARYFDLGYGTTRQLGYANASLAFHRLPLSDDLDETYREKVEEYDLVGIPDNTHHVAAWGHLNGYAAGYYTYKWSDLVQADLLTRFEAAGLADEATARAYRETVLAPGSSKRAADLIADFLGRPVSVDAFRTEMEKAAEAD